MKLQEYLEKALKDTGKCIIGILELDIELDDKLNVRAGGGQRITMTVHNIK